MKMILVLALIAMAPKAYAGKWQRAQEAAAKVAHFVNDLVGIKPISYSKMRDASQLAKTRMDSGALMSREVLTDEKIGETAKFKITLFHERTGALRNVRVANVTINEFNLDAKTKRDITNYLKNTVKSENLEMSILENFSHWTIKLGKADLTKQEIKDLNKILNRVQRIAMNGKDRTFEQGLKTSAYAMKTAR